MSDPTGTSPAAIAGAAVGAGFAVLGIPLGALAAALLGAGFSYMPRGAQPNGEVPLRLLGVLMDAFLGGWLAVLLTHVPYTTRLIGTWDAAPVVLAALLAFAMQVIRVKAAGYADKAFQSLLAAVVSRIGKKDGDA